MTTSGPDHQQITSVHADDRDAISAIRELFTEYERAINVDLCFQGFEKELTNLPGEYAKDAGGVLLLARMTDNLAGCVAFRRQDADTCEVRRLYVRPDFRGTGLGRRLVTRLIEQAKKAGYANMQLHTLPRMEQAVALYESMGFMDITGNRGVPIEGVQYMELKL